MAPVKLSPEGGSYRVAVGDEPEVELEEIGSSGFIWRHDPTDGVLLIDEEIVADRSSPPGSPAIHRFRFRVEASGDLEVRLIKARPWAASHPSRTLLYRFSAAEPTATPSL